MMAEFWCWWTPLRKRTRSASTLPSLMRPRKQYRASWFLTEKFDPYKTTIGQPPPASQGTTEPRARITQDLTPVEPPPPPPETSAPDSGTLPRLPPPPQPPPQPPPTQPPPQSGSGPIATSAPLPPPATPSPQFPVAAQAQPVQPLAAAGPKKKSKVFLILGILAVLLVLGVGVLGAAYIFAIRPMLRAPSCRGAD